MQQGGKRSGGDPFVIALAMVKSGTVVTEEKPTGNIAKPRIPDVCDALGVHCLTPKEYIEAQGVDVLNVCGCGGSAHPFGSVPRTCQDRREQGGQGDTDRTCRLR